MDFNFNLEKSTGTSFNQEKGYVEKFYFLSNKKNIKFLQNEFQGYKWYLKTVDPEAYKNLKKFKKNKKVISLRTPVFPGHIFKFWNRNFKNKDIIEKVLNHYKEVWSFEKKFPPYHGDLTLSNIIFSQKKEVRIIDWEFFEKKQPWGLDICNFLISLIALPALAEKKENLREEDALTFQLYWRSFFYDDRFEYLENPILFLKKKTKLSEKNYLTKLSQKLEKNITYLIKDAQK